MQVSRGYWLEDLTPGQVGDCLAALAAHWGAQGFQVIADARPAGGFVAVEHADDGFRMEAVVSDAGRLSLSASSPCVSP